MTNTSKRTVFSTDPEPAVAPEKEAAPPNLAAPFPTPANSITRYVSISSAKGVVAKPSR